ncbi:hypothetical protein GLOIN_2v1479954 [Rhizophagus irregularis DAOM 181602=DAOM 197198]|nr:hypothetical protein GLOIN_2v1479954 [Rhizophagus irregularis DAOM 181602=DAOM 197198]
MCLFPVILIVDGMQIALINENDDKDKKSVYYSFLTEISAAATNNDNPLNHCMLHRTFAQGNVFEDTPLLRMLIDDMGGNGRALGALELAVKDFKSFENINFLSIAETVFYQLKCHYEKDELSNKGTLTCPYIWLWLMANASDDDDKTKRYFDAKQSFGEETIINKSLSLEQAIYNRESTKSNAYSTNKSEIHISRFSAQTLLSFILSPTSEFRSQKMYDDEYEKATDEGNVFVLVTCGSSDVNKLQSLSAIVGANNWRSYFGPFTGRAKLDG